MLKSIPFYSSLFEAKLEDNVKVSHSHILIYGAIEVHSFGHLGCIASNETIAQETGLEKSTVSKCLSQISKAGWIQVTMENGKRKPIIPLLTIATPLLQSKPPLTPNPTPPYSGVNIDNILENNVEDTGLVEPIQEPKSSKKKVLKHEYKNNYQDICLVIKKMEFIDPKNKLYYNNHTQKSASDFLISEYTLIKVLDVIEVLPILKNTVPYFPSITTPFELQNKWVKAQEAINREKIIVNSKKPEVMFTPS